MSITLSIPPAIVQEVREWAESNGTSLNQYVRDCLEAKCAEIQAVLKGGVTLDGEWKAVEGATAAEKAAMRFFKVVVVVP